MPTSRDKSAQKGKWVYRKFVRGKNGRIIRPKNAKVLRFLDRGEKP